MMTDSEALARANAAFTGSTTYFDSNIRPQVERDLRAFLGRHDPTSKYSSEAYRSRSRVYRPKTRGVIRKNEAIAAEAFFSTTDVVSTEAVDESDPVQQASAEIMQGLLQYRLKKSIPWFQTLLGAYQDAQTVGVVISFQDWEFDPQKGIDAPCVKLVPVENFRFDPGADWTRPIETSPYLIQLLPMYAVHVRRRMQPSPNGTPAKWRFAPDAVIKSATASFDSTRLLREEQRTDSTDKVTDIGDFTVVWVRRVIMEDDDQDVVYYTLGEQHLLSAPEPIGAVWAHGRRPYVLGASVIETHKPYPSSEPRITRDLQSEINELANQRIDNVKFALSKRFFVARNKQVDLRSLTRNVPGSITLLQNPETDVKVMETPDVTASSYSEQDRLNLDFDDITGNFSTSSVQSNRQLNETVGGMEMLNNGANQISNYKLKTFVETWVEPVLRQLALLEQCYETDETILALAGKSSEAFQRLGLDRVTDELLMHELTVSVNAGTGATSPSQKINALLLGVNGIKTALGDGLLEKYGLDPVEVIKEVFGALGHKDGGRFFKSAEGQDPRLVGLQQQIQQLQQALDAKHPPELLAAQVELAKAQTDLAVANKVKIGVDSAYAAMQAGEVIAMAPQVAPVADKVMQSAGYQLPIPPGVDPNYPAPAQALGTAGQTAQATGADVAAQQADVVPDHANTNPMFPGRPGEGAMHGIETQRADGG